MYQLVNSAFQQLLLNTQGYEHYQVEDGFLQVYKEVKRDIRKIIEPEVETRQE